MTRFMIPALTTAALALPVLTGAAQAQVYQTQGHYAQAPSYHDCERQHRNRQVAGAVIGGVLGAVIGAEIHDDRQDRARERRHDYYDRGYRGRDRHGRRGRHHRRHHRYHEDGNDGAVLAGAGLGALAGSAIAGQTGGCQPARHNSAGYGATGGYAQPYENSYGYDQGYEAYDQSGNGYAQASNGELLGSESYGYDEPAQPYQSGQGYNPGYSLPAQPSYPTSNTRTYTASTQAPTSAGACRNMRSGNGSVTWMCQGADGIWRPAQN